MRRGCMRRWSIIMLVSICCLASRTAGSAIPMWEFLTRDEKMSHLYRIFGKQVARYCSDSPLPDCNKNLLVNGIRSLVNMDDIELDQLDPYQRGAKDTIWRAMVGENRSTKSKFGHEDPYYSTDPLAFSGSDHNGLGEESAPNNDYVRPSDHTGPYLVGPMIIRVLPDGRPVPGDAQRPLPRDEDVEELEYPPIPSVDEIKTSSERFFYKNPSYDATGNTRNTYVSGKTGQRPIVISTTKNSHYRRVNPLYRERLLSDKISAKFRPIRFY